MIWFITLSRDGKTLYSCSQDQTIIAWDVASGEVRYQLSGHQGYIVSLCLNEDESLLASGAFNNTVRVWDLKTQQQIREIKTASWNMSVSFMGDKLVVAGDDYCIKVFNAEG